MSPAKSALAGLAVGLIAYFGASWVGAKPTAQIGADVAPSLAPAGDLVPNVGTKSGTKFGTCRYFRGTNSVGIRDTSNINAHGAYSLSDGKCHAAPLRGTKRCSLAFPDPYSSFHCHTHPISLSYADS